jgi:protein involved in polysaccharide export with SLBB domain
LEECLLKRILILCLTVAINSAASYAQTTTEKVADAKANDHVVKFKETSTVGNSTTVGNNRDGDGDVKFPGSESGAGISPVTAPAAGLPVPLLPTNIYRVGIGDILDIRLKNASTRESTLFSVMPDGNIEYPLAGDPFKAVGLTADEIGSELEAKIKIYDKPTVAVEIREYSSHSLIVTGLVFNPGARTLRREAVPLCVVLAEAEPRPEAARATIIRPGVDRLTLDLRESKSTDELVYPGDIITLTAPPALPPPPPQYVFIGGEVVKPGQMEFHAGLTLMQAILASGGISRAESGNVRVYRQGKEGLLVATEYSLKQIEAGKAPDPPLIQDDRIEIGRSR